MNARTKPTKPRRAVRARCVDCGIRTFVEVKGRRLLWPVPSTVKVDEQSPVRAVVCIECAARRQAMRN